MGFCDDPSWRASSLEKERVRSFDGEIDSFLSGGLALASLTEWGAPMGCEGRQMLLPFLANVTRGQQYAPAYVLWINGYDNLDIFPPAWFARGLVPEKTVFARSQDVMVDLKRVFLASLFKMIVIDSPEFFSLEDGLFLRRMAQKQGYGIVILRNYFLSNKKGNIASSLRLNAWRDHENGCFVLQGVKGARGLLRSKRDVYSDTV